MFNKKRVQIISIVGLLLFLAAGAAGVSGAEGLPGKTSASQAANVQAAPPQASPQPAPPEAAPAGAAGRLYGIGSVSKIFTAAAVMKLAEEGKLQLDEPVVTYIPDFAMADERYTRITPRMLLSHSSGLMGSTGGNVYLLGDGDTANTDRFLHTLKSQTLKHDPGDRSIYCNDGFTLAEILVERVSGLSFTAFIEQSFLIPLGLESVKTPQSGFDRARLADIYMGNSELKSLYLNAIGTGGMYASMEDLCRFSAIFMDGAEGSVLSKASAGEMAKNQQRMDLMQPGSDTIIRYGLGWDAVDTYPFNQFGIKALSKGGSATRYFANLTVLPEYGLAAAVATSGVDSHEQLIVQEIILAVLEEEGLIPKGAVIPEPVLNLEKAAVPESLRRYAGIYDGGLFGGLMKVDFTEETLVVSSIASRNERPQEFFCNTDGEFISTDGDYFGRMPWDEGVVGVSVLSFAEGKYLLTRTYKDLQGLGRTVMTMPAAEKIEANPVSEAAWAAWGERNDKEYLLVNEKYTSMVYITGGYTARTRTDERAPGYVNMGVYRADETGGALIASAKIADEYTALGYQSTPAIAGRDINDLNVSTVKGAEYLNVNNYRFIDASAAQKLSAAGGHIEAGTETLWYDVDAGAGGQTVAISAPAKGSWFVYDDKMNCVASSLEKHPRASIILPEGGRLAFAGEPGAEFELR